MRFNINSQTLPRLYLPFENCPKETGVKICDIGRMDENGRREARQHAERCHCLYMRCMTEEGCQSLSQREDEDTCSG